jgi:WD40 repeat protein
MPASIKFSSDNKFVVSGYKKLLKLWLVDQRKEVLSFKFIITGSELFDFQMIVS